MIIYCTYSLLSELVINDVYSTINDTTLNSLIPCNVFLCMIQSMKFKVKIILNRLKRIMKIVEYGLMD